MNNVKMQLKRQCFNYMKNLEEEASYSADQVNTATLREILYRAIYFNSATNPINMQQLDWLTQVTLASLIELAWLSEAEREQQLDAVLDILWSAVN